MGRSGLTVASKLTVIRILIVPFFIATVLYYSPDKDHLRLIALGLFAAAAGLDFLDGYLARKFRQETKAGAILDPLADKILLISAFICLYKIGVSFETGRFSILLWYVIMVFVIISGMDYIIKGIKLLYNADNHR